MKIGSMLAFGRRLSQVGLSLAFVACATMLGAPRATWAQAVAVAGLEPASRAAVGALPNAPLPQLQEVEPVTIRGTPGHVVKDQEAIWTSPAHIRGRDLVWLAPLAAATGVAIATDHHTMASVVSRKPGFNHDNVDASNVLLAGLIAIPVAQFGYGEIEAQPHARESGILGTESLADALVLEQGMKLTFWREKPHADHANGKFWQSGAGVDSSFPSSHTVFAWATAAVVAGEYPSPWTKLTVYSMATGVSLTRVLGQEHFPSDVLVGSAAGWLAGHYVYRMRHRWRRSR